MIIITKNTPPDVALAQIDGWQRAKELDLAAAIGLLIARAQKGGLSGAGIVRVTKTVAKEMEKLVGDN